MEQCSTIPYRSLSFDCANIRNPRNLKPAEGSSSQIKMKTAIKRAAEQGTSKQAKRGKSQTKTKTTNVPRNYTSVNLGLGFPKRVVSTLKYVGQHEITSTTGAVGVFRYSCNGLFDPNITGTGHQPMYFDNLMAIYRHYTVIGSKITVRMIPVTSTQGPAGAAVFINDDTSLAVNSLLAASEQSSGTKTVLFAVGQSSPQVLTKTWSAKQTFGGSVLGNDQLQGTVSANPPEQSYYDIVYQDFGAATSKVHVIVELEYTAVFDELQDQAEN